MEFEWDENKNETNKKKHSFSFDEAKEVFNDSNRITYESNSSGNDEKRYITVGKILNLLYSVVFTFRDTVIRIISARRANDKERKDYKQKIS